MSEWSKELPWKGSIWVTVSRVRIPSSLQKNINFNKPTNIMFVGFFYSTISFLTAVLLFEDIFKRYNPFGKFSILISLLAMFF